MRKVQVKFLLQRSYDLRSIWLDDCPYVTNNDLKKLLTQHFRLEMLAVVGSFCLTDDVLDIIGTQCRKLTSLRLSECPKLTNHCLNILSHNLATNRLQNLVHLALYFEGLDRSSDNQFTNYLLRKLLTLLPLHTFCLLDNLTFTDSLPNQTWWCVSGSNTRCCRPSLSLCTLSMSW